MMIRLNKIDYNNFQEEQSDDGAEAVTQDIEPTITTVPCMVRVDSIRCFYPRKHGRPGTRLTFTDRGGFAVSETFEEVRAAIDAN